MEDQIRPIDEGIRTMSRLPGLQPQFALGVPPAPNAHTTAQEIGNNRGSSVALSEVYLLPGRAAHLCRRRAHPGTAAVTGIGGAPTDGREEIERDEGRRMKQPLANLRIVALAWGQAVRTCDNHRVNPKEVDDEDRKGLVFAVPVYLDGVMVGGVSGIVLPEALWERLPPARETCAAAPAVSAASEAGVGTAPALVYSVSRFGVT